MTLEHLSPPLHAIMELRHLLGVRSPVHTVARLANPFGAGSFVAPLVPAGTTTLTTPAPPGVFAVRVRAVSACGARWRMPLSASISNVCLATGK